MLRIPEKRWAYPQTLRLTHEGALELTPAVRDVEIDT